jgi:hypothetical protein
MVKTQAHREALTSIMLSTHQLAVEVLRYTDHVNQPVPRANKLCRLCKTTVETPEHALVTCASSDALVELRTSFLEQLFAKNPELQHVLEEKSETEFLKAMIYSRPAIALVAKFAHDVLQIFYAIPVFRANNS